MPRADRVGRVVGLALRLAALRRKPNREKRIAVVLTNSNARASRIGNAVGLDTPASLLRLLTAMATAGYRIEGLPADGDALLHRLIDGGTYDLDWLAETPLAETAIRVPAARYRRWFDALPERNRTEVAERWGEPPGQYYVDDEGALVLAGLAFGNVLVAVQPPRGYGLDPAAIAHTPDLPPPHSYHALYRWLADPVGGGGWGADAVVHLGKHGTLEWLPGKGVGLSSECYPDLLLGDLPLVYPFIINDPGEGTQAKRRAHAVVVDHLPPPMTTADGYGEVDQLIRLIDEYHQSEQLDPGKLPLLQQQIRALVRQARLDADLGLSADRNPDSDTHERGSQHRQPRSAPDIISGADDHDFAHLIKRINGYLCELTSAQIRDGLHVLGQVPTGPQLADTLLSLIRVPNLDVPSLRSGVATIYGLDVHVLLADPGRRLESPPGALQAATGRDLPTHADAIEAIDLIGRRLVQKLAEVDFTSERVPDVLVAVLGRHPNDGEGWTSIARTLHFVCAELVPNLRRTPEEIDNIVHALDGGYVPAGPSGAPSRGMAHVLPTGRNFYGVDPRALPSPAAWHVGQQLADALLARHWRDEGRCPESVGISIWGTSAIRTHGDDVAEVLALLGVRPCWQVESGRVVGIEVIPLAELGRPRVDVVCRISGFFRDALPHLIDLLDQAFRTVAALDEPPEQNSVRRHQVAERDRLVASGVPVAEAEASAGYRIFGCKPGAYGAGILPLIDERNWQSAADFAEAYVNWGGYAYTAERYGVDARSAFRASLSGVAVAVKNQDNREHDIFDSDDYLQYHGGMIATVRALTGKNPHRYFGDSADPQHVRVRDLREEALRVFRTRVVNPKWIEAIQRHGYKGALELAATVDYIFGYDATADVVDDWVYERLAETYALDPQIEAFFRRSNPWARRDIVERLIEAIERGMWEHPSADVRARLQRAYLQAESDVEGRTE